MAAAVRKVLFSEPKKKKKSAPQPSCCIDRAFRFLAWLLVLLTAVEQPAFHYYAALKNANAWDCDIWRFMGTFSRKKRKRISSRYLCSFIYLRMWVNRVWRSRIINFIPAVSCDLSMLFCLNGKAVSTCVLQLQFIYLEWTSLQKCGYYCKENQSSVIIAIANVMSSLSKSFKYCAILQITL